jgi:hypothetical protein
MRHLASPRRVDATLATDGAPLRHDAQPSHARGGLPGGDGDGIDTPEARRRVVETADRYGLTPVAAVVREIEHSPAFVAAASTRAKDDPPAQAPQAGSRHRGQAGHGRGEMGSGPSPPTDQWPPGTDPLDPQGCLELHRIPRYGIDSLGMIRFPSPLAIALVTLGLIPPAFAAKPRLSQEKAEAQISQEKAARKACALGDYQKGVDILADLFVESEDPAYVFNQGRCYQESGRFTSAIARFQEYLRKNEGITASDRADAERRIKECETSLVNEAQASVREAQDPPVAPAPHPQAASKTPPELARSIVPPSALADDDHGRRLRVAGIVCAAAGLVAVGTGVGLALKTRQMVSDADRKGGTTQDQEDLRKSLVTWGWVSYGVGATAIATGAALYVMGWPQPHSSNLAVLPNVASGGGSMVLKGTF